MSLKPFYTKGIVEAGCDEAGRGCLAGPVVASAVILPEDYSHPMLNDSKKLTEKQRNEIRKDIERDAVSWAVGMLDNNEIDEVNILKASFYAMHRAIDQLNMTPEQLLIDGNRFITYKEIPHVCVVKGDAKYLSIAAASILAKTYRDDLMAELDEQHPGYDWKGNKGYPTKKHRAAIHKLGPTPYHRMSFKLLPDQLTLDI